METRAPAPGALQLVQAFENTADLESGTDALAGPAEATAWLREHDLLDADAPGLDAAGFERAVAAREAIRALLLANNGAEPDPVAVATMNDLASSARLRLSFGADGLASLAPCSDGVDQALGRLLAIVSTSMTEGTWSRFKACREDVCRWVFYDHSKNRSGAWCTMASCGNRAKARNYRRRQSPSA
jgi:predicted RNA-binding Zn ribbon-like protein